MTWYRELVIVVALTALTVGPALAHGGGGGGAGGGGAGAGGGAAAGSAAAGGGAGHGGEGGHGVGSGTGGVVGTTSHSDADASGHVVGAGRGTALSAPGSQHRSTRASLHLSTPMPGKASPPSGVTPGKGKLGTVQTMPGHQSP